MTEPQGGAIHESSPPRRPRRLRLVLTGRKYFSSNASVASFFIVVAITDPDVPVHQGASTFLIPAGTEGLNLEATHHLVGADPTSRGIPWCITTGCGFQRTRCSVSPVRAF